MLQQSDYADPLVQPDTGVLYNLHGITDQYLLDQVEADFTATRA